jgi:type IV secretion system protein VirD4
MLLFNNINDSEDKKTADPVDRLFEKIPKDDTSYTYYKAWSSAVGRTLASIRATFSSRMSVFNLSSMKALTYKDELNLLDLATKKVAIFMVIPDNNSVYNFMAGTLYTQIFQQLYDYADHVCNGPLPRHVRFMMDEFGNIALPNDDQKMLSTSRSRNVSFVIVLQDKQQIEAIFEKYYRTLYGNCSIYLFLGSGEYETCKYYSDLLGDETVVVYNWTRQYGKNGGMSRAENRTGRKIMLPDEVKKLSRQDKCIVYINGEYGSVDKKYDMKKHKNYMYISDGERTEENMYVWGTTDLAVGTISILPNRYGGVIEPSPKTNEKWRLLSPDEIDRILND